MRPRYITSGPGLAGCVRLTPREQLVKAVEQLVTIRGRRELTIFKWELLRSSPGTGVAIVVPVGLTLLAAAFPAGRRGSVVGI
jgi:hypothetical protein